jgi:chemotaxis protein CheX
MPVAAPELARIAADIWTSMLGLELEEDRLGDLTATETLTGCVQITGDWEGAVTVQLGTALARRATAVMFGMELDEVTDEEIGDTVGELANMAGGNVKSLLAGSCQLALPSVTSGRDYTVSVRGAEPIDAVTMSCEGEVVIVTILARSA